MGPRNVGIDPAAGGRDRRADAIVRLPNVPGDAAHAAAGTRIHRGEPRPLGGRERPPSSRAPR